MRIQEMFYDDIDRKINGVVKVDQDAADVLKQEVKEYVITRDIRKHMITFFNNYAESFREPTADVGVWISGFFGSGKSHFLKMLSYLLENKEVDGKKVEDYFREKFDDEATFMQIASAIRGETDTILFNIDIEGSINKDKTAVENDACNQRTEVKWVTSKSADESIAGAVTTSFIRGQAFQRINKDGIEQYSKYAYNIWSGTNIFKDIELKIDDSDKCKAFFNLLTTSEAEDLVAFYLYKEKGYIVIPSTNKLSTPLYEFVLLDPQDCGKLIYIQVKKGNIDIDADKYSKLNGEVYLFTSEGNVINVEKHSNIYVISAGKLYEYAISKSALLSYGISMWLNLLNK